MVFRKRSPVVLPLGSESVARRLSEQHRDRGIDPVQDRLLAPLYHKRLVGVHGHRDRLGAVQANFTRPADRSGSRRSDGAQDRVMVDLQDAAPKARYVDGRYRIAAPVV